MEVHFSQCDFGYLRPPKDVFNVTHTEYYIRHGEGKKAVRKIFANGKYYDDELQRLEEFKALIASEKVTLPSDWTDMDTFRFMYSGKLDLKKSLKILKTHLEWKASPERGIVGVKGQKLLEDGIMYISGRDKQYRPIIVVNAYRADLKKNDMKDFTQTIAFVLDTAKKYYFVPGKVENWIIIIESNGAGVLDFPTKLVKAINDVTAGNYTSTLDKLYIMNPSSFLKKSWSLVQSLVDPETATKIAMLTKDEFPQLLEKISIDQIEQCYGGTLPKRTVHWPPLNTMNQPPYTEETISTAQTSQYASSEKDSEKETVEPAKIQTVPAAAVAIINEVATDNADIDAEKEPVAAKDSQKNLEEIEEWNFKGRAEAENDKRGQFASPKLDDSGDSDEHVEIGEIKKSNTHTRQNIIKNVSSQRREPTDSGLCIEGDSKRCESVIFERNEPGSAICGLCSSSGIRGENTSNACNIF